MLGSEPGAWCVTARLRVNGQVHDVAAAGSSSLLHVLRNDLGLTGTKVGCEAEQCGACTVLLDGAPRMACRVPLSEALAHDVTTVEGLERDGKLHPLQKAFLAENAAQCGYCTPGILVRAAALLVRSPALDDARIRHALRDHLCRCGAHNRVVRAVRRVSAEVESRRAGNDGDVP